MNRFRLGWIVAVAVGAAWGVVASICVTVAFALASGAAATPSVGAAAIVGAAVALGLLRRALFGVKFELMGAAIAAAVGLTALRLGEPFGLPLTTAPILQAAALTAFAAMVSWALARMLRDAPFEQLDRHEFEHILMRFFMGFGYVFFIAAVAIPFYVMVMTSLKSQQELLANPLDFSIDFSRGGALFRSYYELFTSFQFGSFLWTSFIVSVATVAITLAFSIPGAYAVARLRFKGRASLSRSILLIYMVPMIVLALPIYVAFSLFGLRNSLVGLLLIYPVTTIPVALYMLQGYFRGLPAEIEEAGLMDGLSRVAVIWRITLPLSLPAIASVSLYVFMIAWNEFLLAFMLLDTPSTFTLTRGVQMLNSSEIPRQHLMAGAVIATVPVMALFLALERFMTKGLTAGSVKG